MSADDGIEARVACGIPAPPGGGDEAAYTFREGPAITIIEAPPGSDEPARAWCGDDEIPLEEALAILSGEPRPVVVDPGPADGPCPVQGCNGKHGGTT